MRICAMLTLIHLSDKVMNSFVSILAVYAVKYIETLYLYHKKMNAFV
jgi:hypothetical protein